MEELKIKLLSENAKIPTRNNPTDAGLDLYASDNYDIRIYDQEKPIMVETGVSFEIPDGYVGLIFDRSGMGSKGFKIYGGVIDASYRGSVKVLLYKVFSLKDYLLSFLGFKPAKLVIKSGDKIAQILIVKVETPKVTVVNDLSETNRGEKGFGSSGY